MIKSYIKNTNLFKSLLGSNLYYKFSDPKGYKTYQEELRFYKQLLKSHSSKSDLIFDVGANMGRKALIFSKLVNKVIAFEPTEKIFRFLQKRFENSNVIPLNYALGSTVSTSDLYIVEGNEAYNTLNKKHIETTVTDRGIIPNGIFNSKKVKVETLENFIKKFGMPKYVKIDVEGYELEVVRGLKTPVPIISFEVNLPEFLEESVQSISYLDTLSRNKYLYNFTLSNSFIKDEFVSKEGAIDFLINTELKYLEVYAKLN